jgi:hypothetical protein
MWRKGLVAAIVVLLPLLAIGTWWVYCRSEPLRPPELFGKVQAIRPADRGVVSFLVRSTQPNRPGWDSEQNAHHRKTDLRCWVRIRSTVLFPRREGGSGPLAVGDTVSVWCSGPMSASIPAIWGGQFVVIEPADR